MKKISTITHATPQEDMKRIDGLTVRSFPWHMDRDTPSAHNYAVSVYKNNSRRLLLTLIVCFAMLIIEFSGIWPDFISDIFPWLISDGSLFSAAALMLPIIVMFFILIYSVGKKPGNKDKIIVGSPNCAMFDVRLLNDNKIVMIQKSTDSLPRNQVYGSQIFSEASKDPGEPVSFDRIIFIERVHSTEKLDERLIVTADIRMRFIKEVSEISYRYKEQHREKEQIIFMTPITDEDLTTSLMNLKNNT